MTAPAGYTLLGSVASRLTLPDLHYRLCEAGVRPLYRHGGEWRQRDTLTAAQTDALLWAPNGYAQNVAVPL